MENVRAGYGFIILRESARVTSSFLLFVVL